jgi:hypothetical protein
MSGVMDSSDFTAEGAVHAMQLAGDALRLSTETRDQLNAAAGFLAKRLRDSPKVHHVIRGESTQSRGSRSPGRRSTQSPATGVSRT